MKRSPYVGAIDRWLPSKFFSIWMTVLVYGKKILWNSRQFKLTIRRNPAGKAEACDETSFWENGWERSIPKGKAHIIRGDKASSLYENNILRLLPSILLGLEVECRVWKFSRSGWFPLIAFIALKFPNSTIIFRFVFKLQCIFCLFYSFCNYFFLN